jgi:hypothetical protein
MSLNVLTGCPPGQEGRGFSQDVLFLFEPPDPSSQLGELFSLVASQTVLALSPVALALLDPAAQHDSATELA